MGPSAAGALDPSPETLTFSSLMMSVEMCVYVVGLVFELSLVLVVVGFGE
jgi:hypothetical protein